MGSSIRGELQMVRNSGGAHVFCFLHLRMLIGDLLQRVWQSRFWRTWTESTCTHCPDLRPFGTSCHTTYEILTPSCYPDHYVMLSTLQGYSRIPISLAVSKPASKNGSRLNVPAPRTPTLTVQSSLSLSHVSCTTINTLSSLRSFT